MASLSDKQMERARALLRDPNLTNARKERLRNILTEAVPPTPAPQGIEETDTRPGNLPEATGGLVTRAAFEATGGTVGSVSGGALGVTSGLTTGPAAPVTSTVLGTAGTLAGDALGSAAGSLVFDSVEMAARTLGVLRPNEAEPDPFQPTFDALEAAENSLLFGGGLAAAGGLFRTLKPAVGRVLGLRNQETDEIVKAARDAGIPVGAVDAAKGLRGKALRGTARVVGIFPFFGGGFRREFANKQEKVKSATDSILNTMAPNAVMTNQLGIDMAEAATKTLEEFRTTAGGLYDNFRTLAGGLKDPKIIPSADIKAKAREFIDIDAKGAIRLLDDDGNLTEELLTGPAKKEFTEFLGQLDRIEDTLTVEQYQELGNKLSEFINKGHIEGFDVSKFGQIKEVMEESLTNLAVPAGSEGEAVVEALRTANEFYSKGISEFQTATGKKFGRVDKNFLQAGPLKAGTMNEDQLADVLVQMRSPQAVQDLRKLVGPERMNDAARLHYQRAMEKAQDLDEFGAFRDFNFDTFRKELGLTGVKGEREGFAELLKGTGVDIKKVEDVINTAERIVVPRDVQTFLARRAALGGAAAGLAGAAGVIGLFDAAILSQLGAGLLTRRAMTVISDPAQLEAMRRVLSPTVSATQKRQLLGRLIESAGQAREEIDDANSFLSRRDALTPAPATPNVLN